MSWREKMGVAQYRDAKFWVKTAEHEGGHRAPKHQYPYKSVPWVEDLGLEGRVFPVEGFVVGADYFDARDALLAALEMSGSGELRHPYWGTRRVQPGRWRFFNDAEEGNVVRFSIEFHETPAQPAQPSAVVDAPATLKASSVSTIDKLRADFLSAYQAQAPFLASAATAIRKATSAIDQILTTVQMEEQQLASLKSQVEGLSRSAGALVRTPERLFDSLLSVFSLLTDFGSLLNVYDFDSGSPPFGTTPGRLLELRSFYATVHTMQQLALIQAIALAPDQAFGSYEQALTQRLGLTDKLDEQAVFAGDDLFAQLQQLRADLVVAVPGAAGGQHLLSYTPSITEPSLVVAFRLYGDVEAESDLLTRNHVERPGFVPGGVTLEVLSLA